MLRLLIIFSFQAFPPHRTSVNVLLHVGRIKRSLNWFLSASCVACKLKLTSQCTAAKFEVSCVCLMSWKIKVLQFVLHHIKGLSRDFNQSMLGFRERELFQRQHPRNWCLNDSSRTFHWTLGRCNFCVHCCVIMKLPHLE